MQSPTVLSFYRMHENVVVPKKATEFSSCFDLRAFLELNDSLVAYDSDNLATSVPVVRADEFKYFVIKPRMRVLVPTGLIFDIQTGYSMRFHPRSGLSLKNALILANCEGVIDADYVDPSAIILYNGSDVEQTIFNGDRLCQAEVVKDEEVELIEIMSPPSQKSSRNGGFGSSGRN